MNTKIFYVVFISIAIGGLMWQLAGFGGLFAGQSPGDTLDSTDQVNESARNAPVEDNFTSDASPQDGNLVGTIISGIGTLFDIFGLVVFLPGEIMALGMPRWAARPLGNLATLMISIGLVQLAIGRYMQ
jgi:hypothetical protein